MDKRLWHLSYPAIIEVAEQATNSIEVADDKELDCNQMSQLPCSNPFKYTIPLEQTVKMNPFTSTLPHPTPNTSNTFTPNVQQPNTISELNDECMIHSNEMVSLETAISEVWTELKSRFRFDHQRCENDSNIIMENITVLV